MKKFSWRATLSSFSLLGFLSACGGSSSSTSGLDSFSVVTQGDGFQSSTSQITGSGTILFSASSGSATAHKNYALTFTLQDGGYLKVVVQAKDDLTQGVSLLFTRSGAVLGGTLSAGASESVLTTKLTTVNASGAVTLYLDVDSSRTPARVLVWKQSSTTAADAIIDTLASGHPVSPGNGSGQRWGLELAKGTVTFATMGSALVD